MNAPQRIVLVAAAVAVLVLAFYPPFFLRHIRAWTFDIELAAVTLATIGLLLALRGLPKLSLQLPRIVPAGWKRLWIVLSLVYLAVVTGLAWNRYPIEPSEDARRSATFTAILNEIDRGPGANPLSEAQRARMFDKALRENHVREQRCLVLRAALLWAGPVVGIYLLGVAVRWVYRGFHPLSGSG